MSTNTQILLMRLYLLYTTNKRTPTTNKRTPMYWTPEQKDTHVLCSVGRTKGHPCIRPLAGFLQREQKEEQKDTHVLDPSPDSCYAARLDN